MLKSSAKNVGHSSCARISYDIAAFFSVLFFPWWFVAAMVLAGVFIFQNFPEAVFFGFLIDVFYGTSSINIGGFHLFFSAFFLFVWFFGVFAKEKMRFLGKIQNY